MNSARLIVSLVVALLIAAPAGAQSDQARPVATDRAVTYDDVLKLLGQGIAETEILQRLELSPTLFTLDARQVDDLKKAGASERLLAAMQGRDRPGGRTGDITDFAIILDCSGSMQDRTPEGPSKMEAAKKVVTDLVRRIPNGRRLTFLVYGHNAEERCQAVKVVRPLAELDDAGKESLASAITELRPVGHTPIALALRTAARELAKSNGLSGLILITDGMETCHGDPNAEAARLAANPRLAFGLHVIGFGVEPEERTAVEAIARSGKGKFYDVRSAAKLGAAMAELTKKIEQPSLADRPTRGTQFAGAAVKPGSFFHDAPLIQAGDYQGGLAFMQADYYQVALRKGQELRAIAKIQKTPYRAMNEQDGNNTQTFSITIYDRDLAEAAREKADVRGNPSTLTTFKAIWQAPADTIAYVAIAASDTHDRSGRHGDVYPQGTLVAPSPYTLTLKIKPDAGAGEERPASLPLSPAKAGAGFKDAGEITTPGLAVTDLKLREVAFYKARVTKGETLRLAVAAQKPLYRVMNEFGDQDNKASYTLTVYDDDQVQVSQKRFDVLRNPPDARSVSVEWAAPADGAAYFTISCDNTGHAVYTPKGDSAPGPGRVALQIRR